MAIVSSAQITITEEYDTDLTAPILQVITGYRASYSAEVAPEDDTFWDAEVPEVLPGQYLWIKTITYYTDGDQFIAYQVAQATTGSIGDWDLQEVAGIQIGGPKMPANTITGDHIIAGSIGTDHLTANAITADKLAANTITARELAANSVTAEHLHVGAIQTEHLEGKEIISPLIKTTHQPESDGGVQLSNNELSFYALTPRTDLTADTRQLSGENIRLVVKTIVGSKNVSLVWETTNNPGGNQILKGAANIIFPTATGTTSVPVPTDTPYVCSNTGTAWVAVVSKDVTAPATAIFGDIQVVIVTPFTLHMA